MLEARQCQVAGLHVLQCGVTVLVWGQIHAVAAPGPPTRHQVLSQETEDSAPVRGWQWRGCRPAWAHPPDQPQRARGDLRGHVVSVEEGLGCRPAAAETEETAVAPAPGKLKISSATRTPA